ncbi:MAG: polyphosphate polymerase domain-containing protein [Clostridia bacterium]|nr:polyphosphate polymerase domain-containing protein [Clostridia bacterium]
MPSDIYIFRRIEKKYRINADQYGQLLERIATRLVPDAHGKSTICSLYLDTPDFRIIRASIEAKEEKSVYKEKLRVRSYGTPKDSDRVFFEIKKKYKGVVYKRRVSMAHSEVRSYIDTGEPPFDSQIMREIGYAMQLYEHPKPAMLLGYEREAFFVKDDPNVRLTFDTGIRYRTDALALSEGSHGKTILPEGEILLEIKTGGAMPLWLAHALNECKIYPSSFSKYGTAYADRQRTANINKKEI